MNIDRYLEKFMLYKNEFLSTLNFNPETYQDKNCHYAMAYKTRSITDIVNDNTHLNCLKCANCAYWYDYHKYNHPKILTAFLIEHGHLTHTTLYFTHKPIGEKLFFKRISEGNRQFNNSSNFSISSGNRQSQTNLKPSPKIILSDSITNKILITWILEKYQIKICPIYASFACHDQFFILKKFLPVSWTAPTSINYIPQLLEIWKGLKALNFISFAVSHRTFLADENNILYLNNFAGHNFSAKITYQEHQISALNKYANYRSVKLIDKVGEGRYRFKKILNMADNDLIINYINTAEENILVIYVYLIYYMLYHREQYVDFLWLDEEKERAREKFNKIGDCDIDIYHIFYYLSYFTLREV